MFFLTSKDNNSIKIVILYKFSTLLLTYKTLNVCKRWHSFFDIKTDYRL